MPSAKVERYTDGHTEETFSRDEKTIDAVVRNFQVIGEAARRIPSDIQSAYPQIPWSEMQKMRHVLVHDYDRVDTVVIWRTIKIDLPPLIDPLTLLLSESED